MLLIKVSSAGVPVHEVRSSAEVVTIGRDAGSSVVLEDPSKYISRLHATIRLVDGAYFVTVHSRLNPVLVDGRVLRTGQTTQLNDGAQVTLSPYELSFAMISDAPRVQATTSLGGLDDLDLPPGLPGQAPAASGPGSGGIAAAGVPVDDPFSVLDALGPAPALPGAPVADPFQRAVPPPPEPPVTGFADLLGEPGPGRSEGADGADLPLDPLALLDRAGGAASRPAAARSAAFDLLEDAIDPLAALPHPSQMPQVDPALPKTGSGGFGGGRSGLDHVHDVNLPFTPPQVAARTPTPRPAHRVAPSQWPPLESAAGGAAALPEFPSPVPLAPSVPLSVDPFQDGFDPFADLLAGARGEPTAPDAVSGHGAPAAVEPLPASPGPGILPDAATGAAAFLRGLGLPHVQVPPGEEAVFLEQAGLITHTVVETLMVLLLSRAEVKRELRAEDRTMLGSRDNNPLKMISDPAEALRYLFDPGQQRQGFLPPVQAVEDAAQELRAHDIALVAGLRAAVLGTIRRFDPQTFEKAAAKSAGPLAINRRARSWDAFVEAYAKLDSDAADSVDRIFQRDFLRAYSEQVRLLSAPRR